MWDSMTRDKIGRAVLAVFAGTAVVVGTLALLGIWRSATAPLAAIGAIGGGLGLLRFLRERKRAA